MAAAELRAGLLTNLASALRGDVVAAEFLLLNMISRVYGYPSLGHDRPPNRLRRHSRHGQPLGKFALGLSNFSRDSARDVAVIVSSLLPHAAYLPLSLDFLRSATVSPYKNHQVCLSNGISLRHSRDP